MASQRKLINQKTFYSLLQYYIWNEGNTTESIFMRVRAHVCLHWTRRKNRVLFPVTWEYQGSPKAHLAWWDVQARNLGNKLLLELQNLIITSLATKSYKYDEIKPFQCHCSQLQGVFPYDPQPCRRIERWEKNLVSFKKKHIAMNNQLRERHCLELVFFMNNC